MHALIMTLCLCHMHGELSNELTSSIFEVPVEHHCQFAEGLISHGAQRENFNSNSRNLLLNVK